MARLVDDLLLLSNADSKTWTIQAEGVSLDALLIDVTDSFLPMANAGGQSLSLKLPDTSSPTVKGDGERLAQVVSILLDNALTYTPAGGTVEVSLDERSGYIYITVADSGIGIPDEHKKNIFDRFYRIDKARSGKDHYGLGLSVATEIVRLHHGQISVRDSKAGGAEFVIRLAAKENK